MAESPLFERIAIARKWHASQGNQALPIGLGQRRKEIRRYRVACRYLPYSVRGIGAGQAQNLHRDPAREPSGGYMVDFAEEGNAGAAGRRIANIVRAGLGYWLVA
jgi:hypothetical protein